MTTGVPKKVYSSRAPKATLKRWPTLKDYVWVGTGHVYRVDRLASSSTTVKTGDIMFDPTDRAVFGRHDGDDSVSDGWISLGYMPLEYEMTSSDVWHYVTYKYGWQAISDELSSAGSDETRQYMLSRQLEVLHVSDTDTDVLGRAYREGS